MSLCICQKSNNLRWPAGMVESTQCTTSNPAYSNSDMFNCFLPGHCTYMGRWNKHCSGRNLYALPELCLLRAPRDAQQHNLGPLYLPDTVNHWLVYRADVLHPGTIWLLWSVTVIICPVVNNGRNSICHCLLLWYLCMVTVITWYRANYSGPVPCASCGRSQLS